MVERQRQRKVCSRLRYRQVAPQLKVPAFECHMCDHKNLDGHHRCVKCKANLEYPSDIRLATEVARLESFAKESYGIFALDQVTTVQPRSQRAKASAEALPARGGGRSKYGVLRGTAVGNYDNLVDHLQQDPFFQFNAAQNQLTPPCLEFIERLAISISPDFSRSFAARASGKGTDVKTRLVFIPFSKRQTDHEIDVTYESAINCSSWKVLQSCPIRSLCWDGHECERGTLAGGVWME